MDKLNENILRLSKRLNELSGTNSREFIVHCRKEIKKILGKRFDIVDYSYEVVSTNELQETQNKDGTFQCDIWITIKPTR